MRLITTLVCSLAMTVRTHHVALFNFCEESGHRMSLQHQCRNICNLLSAHMVEVHHVVQVGAAAIDTRQFFVFGNECTHPGTNFGFRLSSHFWVGLAVTSHRRTSLGRLKITLSRSLPFRCLALGHTRNNIFSANKRPLLWRHACAISPHPIAVLKTLFRSSHTLHPSIARGDVFIAFC